MALTATPIPHADLCLKLSKTLTLDNFDNIKDTVKADEFGSFKDGELEGIKTVAELLKSLEDKRIIRVGDYRKLKEIMEMIGRKDVIDVINETERALQEQGYSIATGADDDQLPSCSSYGMESHASPTTSDTSYSQTCQHTSMVSASLEVNTSPKTTGFFSGWNIRIPKFTLPKMHQWFSQKKSLDSDIEEKGIPQVAGDVDTSLHGSVGVDINSQPSLDLDQQPRREATTEFSSEKTSRTENASSQVDLRQEDTQNSSTPSGNTYISNISNIINNPVNSPITSGTSKDNTTNYVTGAPDKTSKTIGEEEQSPTTSQVADAAETALKRWYTTTGSFVQMIPWIGDDKMHIMDIYTKLLLVGSQTKLESYEDIFFFKTREGHLIKRAILNGSAGLGKTTLFDKMAYDWAEGSSETLGKYKLVFVLKMRELEQTSELMDAIFDQLLDEDTIDRSKLNKFINSNPDKVLILLDGFDEFQTKTLNESSFGSILKILHEKKGREMCVFVTTRPSHYDKLVCTSLVQQPFTHVSVLGFSAKDIEQYVNRFYTNEDDKAKSLIQRIQSSNVLCDLAKSPMLLLLMCLLWRDNSQLPDTMTRLYSEALRYIFKRKAKDMSPDEISKIVIAIGKVALHGLLSAHQLLSFKETDFENTELDKAIRAGILTSQRVLKGLDIHHSVHFIHKTFQEYCAAMYWQSLLITDTGEYQEIIDQIDRVEYNPSSYEYLLRFCCGDNEKCTSMICQILMKGMRRSTSDDCKTVALKCFFESQSENLPSVDLITSVVTENIDIIYWNSDSINSFLYLLKNVTNQTMSRGNSYLDKVRTVSIKGSNLHNLGNHLSGMTNLSSLHLINCSLTASNMEYIASSLENKANLTDLNLKQNVALGSSAVSWSPHLKQMKHLQKLDLSNCSLEDEDMKHIAVSLSDMPTLVELGLSSNEALGDSAISWSPHLKQMKHLQKLHLSDCSLDDKYVEHIAVSLSDMPNLVELDLSQNKALYGYAILWSPHLKQMKHLQKLNLSNNVNSKDLKYIALSVGHMSNLVYCIVSNDRYLVEQTSAGIKLDLSGCSLTGTDLVDIVEAMSNWSDLVELILSKNDGLGGSAVLWSPHLKKIKHLQKLDLSDCSLEDEDMKHSDMPTLVELDLSSNEALGDSAISWSPHLKQMKHLQKLNLGDCSLEDEDMKHIAVSLSDMPKLVELNLSRNKAMSGCAITWTPHLKQMKHLQKLHLSDCALDDEYVKHIAVSLSDMPNLVELDLSQNKALYGYAILWSSHLKQMKHLQKLNLSNNVNSKDLKYLALSVGHMSNLVCCIVSNDRYLVEQTSAGIKLDLSGCSLTVTDLVGIVEAMSNRSDLVELILSKNDGLGGSAVLWSPHLKQMKHLQKLDLSDCSLEDEDMKHIAVSLSDMPTMVELNLSCNKALGGSAVLWSPHLKKIKHLQKLDLSNCSLKDKDMEHITVSLSDMPTLVELNLSGNE